jgi:hypothetical protein
MLDEATKEALLESDLFTPRERMAYRKFLATDEDPIALSTQAKFFELFVIGKSCEEIRKLNAGFSLGQIMAARLEGEWEKKRNEAAEALFEGAKQRVQQTMLETAMVFCDILTAKNKQYSDKIMRYIQTGDEAQLADLQLGGIKGYKDLIEALQKIAGQEPSRLINDIVKKNKQEQTNEGETASIPAGSFSSEQAAKILEGLVLVSKVDK